MRCSQSGDKPEIKGLNCLKVNFSTPVRSRSVIVAENGTGLRKWGLEGPSPELHRQEQSHGVQ